MLLSAAEAVESVSVGASLLAAAGTDGWAGLVVQQILQADHARGVRTVFLDGVQMMQSDRALALCDGVPCPVTFVAVGTEAEAPLRVAIHRLQLFSGLVDPNATSLTGSLFAPLSYHTANSRWVEISRGLDGIDVTWDTIGWERAAHEQVKVTLDPAGRISIKSRNVSALLDRAVASVGGITGDSATAANWSSTALNMTGTLGLHIDYVDSDPCFGEACRGIHSVCSFVLGQ